MANKIIENAGFHHIALVASDLERSLKFYTEGLGMSTIRSWGEGKDKIVMLDIGNGDIIELFGNGENIPEQYPRYAHLAIATTDPDKAYKAALQAGAVTHMEPSDVDIQSDPVFKVRIAFVKGPDDEIIEFFHVR